ncbi:Hypothetical_protein [Hexamita inflata]|uniref:Hypothetical_protein n=1 Tax=Hexamita inflata TaxID=28002 RepID=A0ABP1GU76_9EUKA
MLTSVIVVGFNILFYRILKPIEEVAFTVNYSSILIHVKLTPFYVLINALSNTLQVVDKIQRLLKTVCIEYNAKVAPAEKAAANSILISFFRFATESVLVNTLTVFVVETVFKTVAVAHIVKLKVTYVEQVLSGRRQLFAGQRQVAFGQNV